MSAAHGADGSLPAEAEVVVVGAGPVGLMLAGELRLGGVETVVLERLAEPHRESRAAQLSPRTVELLLQRGLRDALGAPPGRDVGHFGGIPLDVTRAGGPVPANWMVPQFRTEEILHDWATGLGATVRRGRQVADVRDDGGSVVLDVRDPDGRVSGGTTRMRARYVVGCDGRDGVVGGLAGIALPGRPASRELLRADVTGVHIPPRRFDRLPHGVAVAGALPHRVTRLMVLEYGRAPVARPGPPEFGEVADAWKRVTGDDISTGEALWTDVFDDTCRQAAEYRRGRVLLAGDAARLHMPVGGQSLNTGLHDAVNLGWKLAAQVRGWAPDGLLDTYHAERHAVGARVLDNVEAQTTLQFDGVRADPLREVFAGLLEIPAVAAHLAAMLGGVDVRYPVRRNGADGDRAADVLGRRLPPLRDADDPAPLPPGTGALLSRRSAAPGTRARVEAAAVSRPGRVRLVPPEQCTALLPPGVDAALLRPDGHVVWTDTVGEGLEDALQQWFGPPAR
ncbi:FAD-dependent monooxygenase [Actinomadura rugatobispora]|uniref:FAD-dependent monooxygenase n=1 Tax=Actinomadura rugatobispora TaxID=1994 RepID=A0ABW0ZSN0_9ACTN|nr:FAD-dependent monooxygenase [Actinomadura rugatobispora]